MIYLDSSALVKLVFEEAESPALVSWLDEREALPRCTSELSTVELLRVCVRLDPDMLPSGRMVIAGLDLIPITHDIVEQAVLVRPAQLRSLDAIHLASALALGTELTALITYDTRLRDGADGLGLPVAVPAHPG